MTDQHTPTDSRRLPSGGAAATKWTTLLGVVLIAVAISLPKWPDAQARFAVIAIGLFIISLAVLRPPGFWDAGSVRTWRDALGDGTVVAIYSVLGVTAIIWAITATVN